MVEIFKILLVHYMDWSQMNLKHTTISGRNWKKKTYHHLILHIGISLGAKFQLKQAILIFWIKFAQKGYFRSKTEKVSTIIEFCMFELAQLLNFNLN